MRKEFNVSNNIYEEKAKEINPENRGTVELPLPFKNWHETSTKVSLSPEKLKRKNVISEQSSPEKGKETYNFTKLLLKYSRKGIVLLEVTPLNIVKEGNGVKMRKKAEESVIELE